MLDTNSKSSVVRSNSRMKERNVTANDSSKLLDSKYNTG